ncbi:EthD domain-containing protein [Streptomyces sp. TS71-3]|uniref:EthD domain-containing protein n=1 Tax=Streptomyces sp. TS71-3 TaxID=2733862 RepID=UPI001B09090F|nr:EthD domain-containing protein [Streptomyces sp. TS71-3]GHJ35255.1 hypothetical protein Sm713_08640 [Streptomyces sp. TS71-3]
MHTVITVVRKRPEVSTEDFRRFMETEYGPVNAALPEVREYVQYYVSDLAQDGAEEPVDAIVRISFDSEAAMRDALDTDVYRKASGMRKAYMRDTSVGVHSAVLERQVEFV